MSNVNELTPVPKRKAAHFNNKYGVPTHNKMVVTDEDLDEGHQKRDPGGVIVDPPAWMMPGYKGGAPA